ncbi:MAG: leucine-rich repeat domain-containing protein [Clostridiales bacterium]|nr:leucine-rich repeat domain-containing protein [Clostridiales bacterium]
MKKKFLSFILALCLIIPATFMLSACKDNNEQTYTITFKNYDGTIISENKYVKDGEIVIPNNPTKPADNTYTYSFSGWDIEIPDEITEDLIITALYTPTYIEYDLSFPQSDISINKGGTELTNSNTLHYGDVVLITELQPVDEDVYHVDIQIVGAAPTSNVNEYIVQGNVSITYSKSLKYSISNIPNGVSISKNGTQLTTNDTLLSGDIINITYTERPGYEMDEFMVYGATQTENPNEYEVTGNLSIVFVELQSKYTLAFPSNLIVKRNNLVLTSESKLYYGDIITIERASGYEATDFIVTGATPTLNTNEYEVTGNVIINSNAIKTEYSLSAPEFITITRNGIALTSQDILYYGDVLLIDFESIGHTSYDFYIDGANSIGENEYEVIDNVVITQDYINLTIISDKATNTYRLSTFDSIWSADQRGDFDIDYSNSIGFYLDSDFKNNIPDTTTFNEDATVYTLMATLDKLTLTGESYAMTAAPINAQITGTVIFPRNVQYINSFMWTGITSVIIPANVRIIHSNAFAQCSSLESITFLGNVSEFQETAFHNSTNLKTIIINNETFANSFVDYNSNQRLLTYVETIYIAENIDDISDSIYITDNFTKQETSDKTGYDMYVKNSTES